MATSKYQSRLLEKRQVARDTLEFVLEKPAELRYRAGQYFDIFLPEHAPDAPKGTWAHGFSFASAPFEPTIAAATRMRSGSAFKTGLAAVPAGSPLEIEAVWGDFTLRKDPTRPVVFLIGGIGITPVRSMVEQATHDGTGHHLTLIYANRTPEDAAFVDDFTELARRNPNFRFVQTWTRAEGAAEHGHIDAAMVRRHVPDIAGASYYMSGPRNMVGAMRDVLEELEVDEDSIHTEEFDGY